MHESGETSRGVDQHPQAVPLNKMKLTCLQMVVFIRIWLLLSDPIHPCAATYVSFICMAATNAARTDYRPDATMAPVLRVADWKPR